MTLPDAVYPSIRDDCRLFLLLFYYFFKNVPKLSFFLWPDLPGLPMALAFHVCVARLSHSGSLAWSSQDPVQL